MCGIGMAQGPRWKLPHRRNGTTYQQGDRHVRANHSRSRCTAGRAASGSRADGPLGLAGSTTIIQGNSDNFNQSCQVGLFNVNNVGNGDFNFNLA
jgi:hypothetical protein